MDLVIVESPAKAKTINKYLGDNFKVSASVGHIRDLNPHSLSLDEHLRPIYTVYDDKQQIVDRLKADAKKARMVYLMSDSDREGEAIAWHLKELLGLQPGQYSRPRFREITKAAILKAINEGGEIDMALVHAQESRRVLDRLIGYSVSPLMSKLYQAPSTGRVQTVVVMLVVDRQIEIDSFRKKPYFQIEVKFLDGQFDWSAQLDLHNLVKSKQFEQEIVQDEKSKTWRLVKPAFAHALENILFQNKELEVFETHKTAKQRKAPPAFTTSTLIQAASAKLSWPTDKTMRVAQTLYESGLISYMRTDQPNLSDDSIEEARAYIMKLQSKQNGVDSKSYLPNVPNKYPVPDNAQEGHEALRPTSFNVVSSKINNEDGSKLYDLIWRRALASQMAPMEYDHTEIMLRTPFKIKGEQLYFKATGNMTTFDGFKVLYDDSQDDSDESNDDQVSLPDLHEGQVITSSRVNRLEKFTRPPPHYTESSLVKEMEKRDIGRPSTYGSTMATIFKRGYVLRAGKNLEASKLAMSYITNIREAFKFVDYQYTSDTENKLDKVANGQVSFEQFINFENAILSEDIADFSKSHKEAFRQCPVCKKNSLIKSRSQKSGLVYWSCFESDCDTFYPDQNGAPNFEYQPPQKSQFDCPRCNRQKLSLFNRKPDKQQRYFGCAGKSCNTILPSTTDTWDSDAPVPDIASWKARHKHKCPVCEKSKRNHYLLLGRRDPQKNMRYYFCESEACNVVIPCTDESWNGENPVPDLKSYIQDHTHACPSCKKSYLKLSPKGTWYCSGKNSTCKVFIPNKMNTQMQNEPDFIKYQEELASRVSCPRNGCNGHLILSSDKQSHFCSDKCGVSTPSLDGKPDIEGYLEHCNCPSDGCKGKLVLTKAKNKFRCDVKSCDVLVSALNNKPNIDEYIKEQSLLKACPECNQKSLRRSKGSAEKKPTYFCTSRICTAQKYTTFVPVGSAGEPDYAAYNEAKAKRQSNT